MSEWTAPENGWYEPDRAAGGWRKLTKTEEDELLKQPSVPQAMLVRFDTVEGETLAWSAAPHNIALPFTDGQMAPARVWVGVSPAGAEPQEGRSGPA